MLPAVLLPETKVRAPGISPEVDLGEAHDETLLLTLGITHTIEQESLDVTVWGSADGKEWGIQPLLSFPQKFYCGTYQALLNLKPYTGLRFLRAKWNVRRWGRGDMKPLFAFYLLAQGAKSRAASA
jgi:hypothetical protein